MHQAVNLCSKEISESLPKNIPFTFYVIYVWEENQTVSETLPNFDVCFQKINQLNHMSLIVPGKHIQLWIDSLSFIIDPDIWNIVFAEIRESFVQTLTCQLDLTSLLNMTKDALSATIYISIRSFLNDFILPQTEKVD
jgi:hypothetical protein